MSEDRLLRDLGHLAKEEEGAERARFDERWDRLAAGTLTAEEEAELRALAETSPEAREAWEAFRPLGPEFQARVVERIAAELPKPKPKPKPKEKEEPRDWFLWFRSAGRIGGWVTAAATAATVLVVLLRPPAPLPDYQIAVTGASSEMRGEQEEIVQLAPGDRCTVLLRPDTEVTRAKSLEARSFLVHSGERRPLEMRSHVEPSGVVMLDGSIPGDLQPGTWTLWAVVGRPGKLPDPAELQSLAARGEVRQRDWVAVSKDIRIQSRAP